MTLIANWQQHVAAAAAAVVAALTFQNDCNELHTTATVSTFHKNNAMLTTNQCNYHAAKNRAPKRQLASATSATAALAKKKKNRRRIKHASCLCQGCCWLWLWL